MFLWPKYLPVSVILLWPPDGGPVTPFQQVRTGSKVAVTGGGGWLGKHSDPVWVSNSFYTLKSRIVGTCRRVANKYYCRRWASTQPRMSVKSPQSRPCCIEFLIWKTTWLHGKLLTRCATLGGNGSKARLLTERASPIFLQHTIIASLPGLEREAMSGSSPQKQKLTLSTPQ